MQLDPGTKLVDTDNNERFTVLDAARLNKTRIRSDTSNKEYVIDLLNRIYFDKYVHLTDSPDGKPSFPLLTASKEEFDRIWPIYHEILPLLHLEGRTAQMVENVAGKFDVHISTVYRWIKLAEKKRFKGLYRDTNFAGKGTRWSLRKSRARPNNGIAKRIFDEVAEECYLTTNRLTPSQIYPIYYSRCSAAGLRGAKPHREIPTERTFRRALDDVDEREAAKKRNGEKYYDSNYVLKGGIYTDPKAPLQIIQIDHTLLDVSIVDETGKVIGRPWVTIGIDAYSRRIWALRIHLDAPSATENAMTMINGAFRKDDITRKYDLPPYEAYGSNNSCVHSDNGEDFISRAFAKGCFSNNMDLIHRPLGTPSYGGYVEAFNKTLTTYLIETLKGKTFRSVADKGDNEPEEEAALTQDQLERLVWEFVVRVYDNHFIDSIGMSPKEKWEIGIAGKETGIAIEPSEPKDILRFKQDFLPFAPGDEGTRVIEPGDGVSVWGWMYSSDVLNHLDLFEGKKRKRYYVRYDPTDVRYVYLYDDKLDKYHELHLASMPPKPFTLKELQRYNEERARRKESGRINEYKALADIYKLQKEMVAASESDKKARRRLESKRKHEQDAGGIGRSDSTVAEAKQNNKTQVTPDLDSDIVYLGKHDDSSENEGQGGKDG